MNEQDISSNCLVKRILRSISVAKIKSSTPPIWDPRMVLQYLSNNNPDESSFYQVSQRVAVLLLFASGRRVHDLTLLRIGPSQLIDEGNSIKLWPAFGSKSDNAERRQSVIRISPPPPQICIPVKHGFKCSCHDGYRLSDDGFTCKSTDPTPPILVFGDGRSVRALDLGGDGDSSASEDAESGGEMRGPRTVALATHDAVALAWARAGDVTWLFWAEAGHNGARVLRAPLPTAAAAAAPQPVAERGLARVEGLAVDWRAPALYWLDSTLRQIEVRVLAPNTQHVALA
ncbi:hypothetical protein ACJJTC_015926 [Scirpophaga incertulas]